MFTSRELTGTEEYRVVCPDGHVVDTGYTEHTVGWAFQEALRADASHDPARCSGRHRVQRCLGWEDVTFSLVTGEVSPIPRHTEGSAR